MSGMVLPLGLLFGGALGFSLGAKPEWLLRPFRKSVRKSDSANPGGTVQASDIIDFLYPLAAAFFAGFVFSTLVPDALTHSKASFLAFTAGLGVMGFLSRFVFKRDPCCEVGHDHRGFGAMSMVAMAVCSVNDGLLIGLLDPVWFSGLNVGMLIHKITSSFAMAQVLRGTRYQGASLLSIGATYTLISPAAFMIARGPLAHGLPDVEWVLAFSAGLLAYVTLTSLVPHARTIIKRRPRTAYGFVFAFIISITLGFWHTALHRHGDSVGVGSGSLPAATPGAVSAPLSAPSSVTAP
jgi:zinc transporter ZupT